MVKVSFRVYDVRNYAEDILLGYRWHDTKKINPFFAFYDDKKKDWVVEPGSFDILVGNASDNTPQTITIHKK